MSDEVIKIEGVCKQYRLGQVGTGTVVHDINRWFYKLRGKEDPYLRIGNDNNPAEKGDSQLVWALRDISFSVKRGEVLGIIGKNGAGKSTLLKILSRVTNPTVGQIKIKGRIASLLEVGTGFHPELTGRENIYLNGAILGMTKREIKNKFDEIVDFSGVERYIDTPVKRYSSGMYVRLAFAVAAHLEPEILIVDEVLAVGDAEFQRKCMGRMKDVSEEGRTVIFVSHNMDSVQRLCTHAVLLKNGNLDMQGSVDNTIEHYLKTEQGISAHKEWKPNLIHESKLVKPIEVFVHDENFVSNNNFNIVKKIGITLKYEVLENVAKFTHGISLYNSQGVNILNSQDVVSEIRLQPRKKGIYNATVWIPGNFLAEGAVYVDVSLLEQEPFRIHFIEKDVISFNVYDNINGDSARGLYHGGFPGVVRPKLEWVANLEKTL